VSFNDQVLLLTEATNDLKVVSAVIQENANTGDSTRLYDAVNLVVNERLKQNKGQESYSCFSRTAWTRQAICNISEYPA